MKRLIVYGICFLLVWTSSAPSYAANVERVTALEGNGNGLYAPPQAQIIHVTPENYPKLNEWLYAKGYRQSDEPMRLAARYGDDAASHAQVLSGDYEDRECGDDRRPSADDSPVSVSVNIISDLTPEGDGVEAAVVFVVIGTVVVAVWTLYAVKFLYDVTVGTAPCGRWSELNFATSMISDEEDQHATFNGVHFMTGYRDGYTDIGLGAEVGQSDILLTETGSLELEGLYWMVGPILRWRLDDYANPSYYEMEFAAGTTEHEEVGLLAKAELGFSFGIGEAVRWGVNLGVLNINLNDNQGIITDRQRYYYLLGLEMGFHF